MNSYTTVIPVHNGEATIYEALLSLKNQTFPPKAILIFNNKSSDNTLREVQKFKKVSQIPIKIENSEKLLQPHESFAGSIRNIEGRFLWLAADDMLFPWSVEKILNAKCSLNCDHSLIGSTVFINSKAEIMQGKTFSKQLSGQAFLRDPADNPIFYGMHDAAIARNFFPRKTFPAWDWHFSFFCVRNGAHIYSPNPTHFREYTSIESHRSQVLTQKTFRKYFPYIDLSLSIKNSLSVKENLQTIHSLIVLNLKGFLLFGKFSTVFEEKNVYGNLVRLRSQISRPLNRFRENSLLRNVFRILPKWSQNLIRKTASSKVTHIQGPKNSFFRLIDENGSRYRANLLSIHNPIQDVFCVLGAEITTAQVIEMIRYFHSFADEKSTLTIDSRLAKVNLSFIITVATGLKRLYPNGKILFKPLGSREIPLNDIDDFYAKILKADLDRDIDSTFFANKFKKIVKNGEVNFFLSEVPQPNRDAGSIDVFYIFSILKRFGVKINVYLPHLVSQNPIARATLEQYSNLELVENFTGSEAINFVYGPYAYQQFATYSLENDFVYIMVDAVFRRAEQSKGDLSLSDKYILSSEMEALQNCRYAFSISEKDRDAVLEKFPSTNTLLFPIMRFPRTINELSSAPLYNLLFIGSLGHTPNRIAADWIAQELAPKLLIVNPKIQLVLAGQGTDKYNRTRANLRGLGLVADLNGLYAESFASIAPMAVAAGVNGKVIESLCYQKPAIISEAVSVNLPQGFLQNCEIAKNIEDYVNIADKIFRESKRHQSSNYNMKAVDGTSNIITLFDLLTEC